MHNWIFLCFTKQGTMCAVEFNSAVYRVDDFMIKLITFFYYYRI